MSSRETSSRLLIPGSVFDQICSGPVASSVVEILRKSQYGRRKVALRSLLDLMRKNSQQCGPFVDADYAWNVLASAERVAPAVVEEILMYPTVGVWSARALLRISDCSPWSPEIGVLHAVAAAAAIRCEIPCIIRVPVVHNSVTLPTVGQFRLAQDSTGYAELRTTSAGVELVGQDTSFRPWKTHRSTANDNSLEVTFDDLDPYREFSEPTPPSPLSEVEYEKWARLLDEAWKLLAQWHEGYAVELSVGLTSLVPLSADRHVVAASSTLAFGSVALSDKGSATELAEALVHELQHSKLNALIDLVELGGRGGGAHFYAPWRNDARPLEGLLHGIYAFTAVAEFWRAQRKLVPESRTRAADFTFAYRSCQVRRAVNSLRESAELTEPGRYLVAAVSDRLAACEAEAVPADLSEVITRIMTDHYATWRIRHVRPRAADAAELADAWLAGRPPPRTACGEGEVLPCEDSGQSARATLLKMRVLEPERFEQVVRDRDADAAYARDDYPAAAAEYGRRIRSGSDSGQAWVGLGLALRSASLLDRPEAVRAVYEEVSARTGSRPDPADLTSWMG